MNWKIVDRFKEPSSWNAIGTILAAIGVSLPSPILQAIPLMGAGFCVLLGFFMKEGVQ
jgi:hypothetical protein